MQGDMAQAAGKVDIHCTIGIHPQIGTISQRQLAHLADGGVIDMQDRQPFRRLPQNGMLLCHFAGGRTHAASAGNVSAHSNIACAIYFLGMRSEMPGRDPMSRTANFRVAPSGTIAALWRTGIMTNRSRTIRLPILPSKIKYFSHHQ
jgi:hypothetical protein